MKVLLFALVFAVILIAVSGRECPLCKNGDTDDWNCTCSGRKLKDNCSGAGLGIGAVQCLVARYCCLFPQIGKRET
ncbi:CLUMA_CG013043, isoform A [Clunio marinus]|uniref:CLUMA_CG013043, isoform A n=1 Tax=Clunio marinus TaxID=568069 RepID=A0A1J1IHT0_9DIPT|nr:CLUMA_CG013043, isoform A [Clunio marinus]